MKLILSISRNIGNSDKVQVYLSQLSEEHPDQKTWVNSVLKNYILRTHEDLKPHRVLKKDPDWMHREQQEPIMDVQLSPRFKMDIEHALGYLKTQERTERISVPDAIRLGNELIERENKRASDKEGTVEVLHTFKDGYTWVSLKDKQALSREGKLMGHCVGQEEQGYLKGVQGKTLEIWSLRDPSNSPHCTVEYLVKGKKVKQIKGKQNKGVIQKYVPYCKSFLQSQKEKGKIESFNLYDLKNLGVLEQDGTWYDIFNLPENFTVKGDLDLFNTKITKLPEGLKVGGNLNISDTEITMLPEGLKVGGSLDISGTKITKLPEGLEVGGNLYLSNTEITRLPEGLEVGGGLDLTKTKITELPAGLKVGGYLDLRNTEITELPEGLEVGGDLYLDATKITELPEGLKVGGSLDLNGTKITRLPEGLEVGGNLYLSNTEITELPEGLEVGGDLYLSGTKLPVRTKEEWAKLGVRAKEFK